MMHRLWSEKRRLDARVRPNPELLPVNKMQGVNV